MTNQERYYLFSYLEAKKENLDLVAQEDSMVTQPLNAKLDFIVSQLKITIQTTKNYFTKVSEKVLNLISNEIICTEIDVKESQGHYVSCFFDTRLNKNFQKKFQDRYNVLIINAEVVQINNLPNNDPLINNIQGGKMSDLNDP